MDAGEDDGLNSLVILSLGSIWLDLVIGVGTVEEVCKDSVGTGDVGVVGEARKISETTFNTSIFNNLTRYIKKGQT